MDTNTKVYNKSVYILSIWMIFLLLFIQPNFESSGKGLRSVHTSPKQNDRIILERGDNLHESQTGSDETRIYLPNILSLSMTSNGPRVNIPEKDGSSTQRLREAGLFWFGSVGVTDNYADVRVSYNQESLYIGVAIFDRLLWYDTTPTTDTLTDWDSIEINFATHGNQGTQPDTGAYRIIAQVNWDVPLSTEYSATYRGNGTGWDAHPIPFEGTVSWRSSITPFFNDQEDDFGWMVTLEVPFTSIGLTGPPPEGTSWGFSARIHDRDDASGTPIPEKVWPPDALNLQPKTWGQIVFGLPNYTPPPSNPGGSITIRNGENGIVVRDAMVGGNTTCGNGLVFWTEWGNTKYPGATQVNVQNQWDVSDQPCFSKYFIDIPLSSIPAGKVIVSATLTLYQFGNSDPSGAVASMIQIFTLDREWDEDTITWNNAPLMTENVSRSRVDPLPAYPGLPGVPRTWDVSMAVSEAYMAGENLNLGFYEADMPMHSGKYFFSSDVDLYMATSRPVLVVEWGEPQ
jgi:hypothetical protein